MVRVTSVNAGKVFDKIQHPFINVQQISKMGFPSIWATELHIGQIMAHVPDRPVIHGAHRDQI